MTMPIMLYHKWATMVGPLKHHILTLKIGKTVFCSGRIPECEIRNNRTGINSSRGRKQQRKQCKHRGQCRFHTKIYSLQSVQVRFNSAAYRPLGQALRQHGDLTLGIIQQV